MRLHVVGKRIERRLDITPGRVSELSVDVRSPLYAGPGAIARVRVSGDRRVVLGVPSVERGGLTGFLRAAKDRRVFPHRRRVWPVGMVAPLCVGGFDS